MASGGAVSDATITAIGFWIGGIIGCGMLLFSLVASFLQAKSSKWERWFDERPKIKHANIFGKGIGVGMGFLFATKDAQLAFGVAFWMLLFTIIRLYGARRGKP